MLQFWNYTTSTFTSSTECNKAITLYEVHRTLSLCCIQWTTCSLFSLLPLSSPKRRSGAGVLPLSISTEPCRDDHLDHHTNDNVTCRCWLGHVTMPRAVWPDLCGFCSTPVFFQMRAHSISIPYTPYRPAKAKVNFNWLTRRDQREPQTMTTTVYDKRQ
jgi:hypothetical protein